jgi:hypothetical protein
MAKRNSGGNAEGQDEVIGTTESGENQAQGETGNAQSGEGPEEQQDGNGGDNNPNVGGEENKGGEGIGDTPPVGEENKGGIKIVSIKRAGKTIVAVTGKPIVFDEKGEALVNSIDAAYLKSCPGLLDTEGD